MNYAKCEILVTNSNYCHSQSSLKLHEHTCWGVWNNLIYACCPHTIINRIFIHSEHYHPVGDLRPHSSSLIRCPLGLMYFIPLLVGIFCSTASQFIYQPLRSPLFLSSVFWHSLHCEIILLYSKPLETVSHLPRPAGILWGVWAEDCSVVCEETVLPTCDLVLFSVDLNMSTQVMEGDRGSLFIRIDYWLLLVSWSLCSKELGLTSKQVWPLPSTSGR